MYIEHLLCTRIVLRAEDTALNASVMEITLYCRKTENKQMAKGNIMKSKLVQSLLKPIRGTKYWRWEWGLEFDQGYVLS